MKTRHSPFIWLLIALLYSCTDAIDTEERDSFSEVIVIEGEISDQPGPYFVKLNTTSSLSGIGANTLGQGAQVFIEEDNGVEIALTEIEPLGTYRTTDLSFRGKIGDSYRVKAILTNGQQYASSFQEIPEPINVSGLDVEFFERTTIIDGARPDEFVGHKLSATIMKEAGINRFYGVEIDGILEAEIGFGDCDPPEPALSVCYSFEKPLENQLVIFDDANVASNEYMVDITEIRAIIKRRYFAEVIFKSWSEASHRFWSSIKDQLDLSGSIFNAPLQPVVGNIRNSDTNELALGNFTAFSVSRSMICFDRSEVLLPADPDFELRFSCVLNCVELWSPATFTPPSGFDFCL